MEELQPQPEKKYKDKKFLTVEDKDFIKDNVIDPNWTDQKFADKFNVSVKTIRRFRKKIGASRSKSNDLIMQSKDDILKSDLDDLGKIEALKTLFKGTKRYIKLKSIMTQQDLEYFIDRWAVYSLEFEDMNVAEEEMLENMIVYKMRIDENRKDFKDILIHEQQLREQLHGNMDSELDLENEQDRAYYELIQSNNKMKLELNKDLKDLVEKYEKIQRSMNATREQREQKTQIGSDTFLSVVKSHNDRDIRLESGKYNERMKMAIDKQLKEMKKPYVFADNEVCPIILDGEEVAKQLKKKKEDDE